MEIGACAQLQRLRKNTIKSINARMPTPYIWENPVCHT